MASWPQLGLQPANLHEHATQLIAGPTAQLSLDRGRRQKLPDQLFEAFIRSVQAYSWKTRDQPTSNQILDKLNQIHHLAKSTIAQDITLIKNAVNKAPHPSTRAPMWAERVKSGRPFTQAPAPVSHPSSASSKEREIIVKLDSPELAALLRQKPPELRRRINDTLQRQTFNSNKAPLIGAAKQLQSGDVAVYAPSVKDASTLKENSNTWVEKPNQTILNVPKISHYNASICSETLFPKCACITWVNWGPV